MEIYICFTCDAISFSTAAPIEARLINQYVMLALGTLSV